MKSRTIWWLAAALLSTPISVNAQSCSVSAPADGTRGTCSSTLSSGSSCSFACDSGYFLVGSATSCTNGTLTAQSCAPSPCFVSPPSNGTLGTCSSSLASGGSCQVSCNAGYTLAGAATSCSYGVLTATQTCAPSSCAVTAPSNGTLGNCPSSLASGSSCQFSCGTGYTLTGTATSCTDGTLTAQTCAMAPPSGEVAPTDGPLPLWAIGALGAGLIGAARRRLKKAADRSDRVRPRDGF
jgi:MYXO-CTERM domain-containing protein